MRRTALIAGLLGLAAMVTGCGIAEHNEDTVAYDVTDKVAALHVETDSGRIEVVESERAGIHVSERLTWSKDKPTTTHEVRGDTLELAFTCPTSWGFGAAVVSCDVGYQVEVPKGLRVKLGTDSGDITLKGLSGTVEATSDSGTIEADGLTAGRVVTKTDSGDVRLAFTGRPDQVKATTDSGRTEVRAPEGPYAIKARTDSGGKEIKATSDPSAPRSIEVSSDSGDLLVATF
ncbi:DUF4097 domain-containing protein [Nonomuraea sp. FMUSA5-5]|uniref:DUF4097 domain-containing protein n=1 Tax=Nonomuraea composti TaxID=2720023 RepID=A0ABX1B5V1_9ACTN|nr:DUF4097 family beta strand repeat-containing protein [Nonomuraea sp. FMUSA5-5]NJP90543.1 DUF4097 domain-containing protein [Nonomuraea sp. FMUSA5-5]